MEDAITDNRVCIYIDVLQALALFFATDVCIDIKARMWVLIDFFARPERVAQQSKVLGGNFPQMIGSSCLVSLS